MKALRLLDVEYHRQHKEACLTAFGWKWGYQALLYFIDQVFPDDETSPLFDPAYKKKEKKRDALITMYQMNHGTTFGATGLLLDLSGPVIEH